MAPTRQVFCLLTAIVVLSVTLIANATAAGAQQAPIGLQGVEGNSYVSPTYGYSLTWDVSWDVVNEQSQDDVDQLALSNGVSSVFFDAFAGAGDEASCLQAAASGIERGEGISDFVQARSDDGPLEGSGEIGVWAVYDLVFTSQEGVASELSTFLLCRALIPGQAMLQVTQVVDRPQYNDQLDPLLGLLNAITLPDETPPPSDEPEQQGDTPGVMTQEELVQFLKLSADDIDAYWARAYPTISNGEAYAPPAEYVMFDAPITMACGSRNAGKMGAGAGPFFCPLDDKVYLDVLFAGDQLERFGFFPVAEVVAHEVGHHVQMLLGIDVCEMSPCLNPAEVTSQELEVMADCFAGAWSRDAETRGRLGNFDIERNIAQYVLAFGDPVSGAGDPGAHGRGALRVFWFLNGYYNGSLSCLEASPATAARAQPAAGTGDGGALNGADEPKDDPEDELNASTSTLLAVGDDFEAGPFSVTVSGTESSRTIGGSSERAEGIWLVVYLEVEVSGNRARVFDFEGFVVQDADGAMYEADLDATNTLLETALPNGIETDLEAGDLYTIAIVYDVPRDAGGFTLQAADGSVTVDLEE